MRVCAAEPGALSVNVSVRLAGTGIAFISARRCHPQLHRPRKQSPAAGPSGRLQGDEGIVAVGATRAATIGDAVSLICRDVLRDGCGDLASRRQSALPDERLPVRSRPPVGREPVAFFSESGVQAVVRPVGKRRLQCCAGRPRGASVASRGGTPRRDAGIQARITTGSVCWVGGGGLARSITADFCTSTTATWKQDAGSSDWLAACVESAPGGGLGRYRGSTIFPRHVVVLRRPGPWSTGTRVVIVRGTTFLSELHARLSERGAVCLTLLLRDLASEATYVSNICQTNAADRGGFRPSRSVLRNCKTPA